MGGSQSHGIIQSRNQYQFTNNECTGIVGDYLIYSYVPPARFKRTVYSNFISNILPGIQENIPEQMQ